MRRSRADWASDIHYGRLMLRTYTDTTPAGLLVWICENDGNPIMFLGSLELLSVAAKNRARPGQS